MSICVSVCVCVCVCVSNTTKLEKDYIFKMSFFLWLETVGSSETGKRLIVNEYFECLRGPSMLLLFTPVDSHWRECVATAKKLCKKRKSVLRRRIYRKYVSWRWLQTQDENLRADVVLSRSRGSPGKWFPETEYVCVRHLCCGNKWYTAQIKLLECKVLNSCERVHVMI